MNPGPNKRLIGFYMLIRQKCSSEIQSATPRDLNGSRQILDGNPERTIARNSPDLFQELIPLKLPGVTPRGFSY